MAHELKDHLIIVGMGHVGYRLAEVLHALGEPFSVVTLTLREDWRRDLAVWALALVEGDARSDEVLKRAGTETARAMLIVTQDDLLNVELCVDAHRLNPSLPLIVRIFDNYLAERLRKDRGIRSVFSPSLLAAPVFTAAALEDSVFRLVAVGKSAIPLLRLTLPTARGGVSETLAEFCQHQNLLPLAVYAPNLNADTPLEAHRLEVGDEILAFACPNNPLYRARMDAQNTSHSRYSLLQLQMRLAQRGRSLWRAVQHTSIALRVACILYVALLGLSVVLFHYYIPNLPHWSDALYFLVAIITTIGFGDINFRYAPTWLKLYGCGVMLGGAAFIAVLYGLLTDYLVGLRVDRALGRHATHVTDHCIVVGLGDVGSRVVENLLEQQERVVAIERDADHEAIPSLQDRIPVLIADANRESSLKKANIEEARAIIVTATDDITSLRIAHLAETLNPKIRSIIRIYNSSLAKKMSEGLQITGTVNAAAEAAATFAASAFQEGVVQGISLGGRLYLLRWLSEAEQREWVGKSGRALMERFRAVAVKRDTKLFPFFPNDILKAMELVLVLEEYDSQTRTCRPPHLFAYNRSESWFG